MVLYPTQSPQGTKLLGLSAPALHPHRAPWRCLVSVGVVSHCGLLLADAPLGEKTAREVQGVASEVYCKTKMNFKT